MTRRASGYITRIPPHLRFADASYDCVVLFFLLHEQPEDVRAQTVAQALRVVKPGGKVIFVDYHRPSRLNPFRYIMTAILKTLEPFAMDLWRKEITEWLPDRGRALRVQKETFFGGLYQKVVVTRTWGMTDIENSQTQGVEVGG